MFKALSSLVVLPHSVFAIPFALIGALVASREVGISASQLSLIVLSVISARTAAMGFNRVVDRSYDSKNPRTSDREIPSGKVSVLAAIVLVLTSSAIFVFCAALLGRACLLLSPLVLALILGYSLTKRFTSLAHYVLGLALAAAPGGAWFAVRPEFSWQPVPLMIGVLLWVAGFDILYSCQDAEFDREQGLFSIPSRYGIGRAFFLSRLLHLLAVLSLAVFGVVNELGMFYWIGLIFFAGFLLSQHLSLRGFDLSRVNQVFFANNGLASVVLALFVCLEVWV